MVQTRKNTRKASRKSSRKSRMQKTQKVHRQEGGRSEWLKKVMRVYKDMKAKNPKTRLGDAMQAAKKLM